jgi:hypothetical protein
VGGWSKFKGFTIHRDGFLKVSHDACVVITIPECVAESVECTRAAWMRGWSKVKYCPGQINSLIHVRKRLAVPTTPAHDVGQVSLQFRDPRVDSKCREAQINGRVEVR